MPQIKGQMSTKSRVPTISQIAERAGVARSSVSRAFTRPELLSAATVLRIKRVAKELGYVPNSSARALSTGKTGNIAFLVPDVANPYFPPTIRSAQLAAENLDYCVFLADFEESGVKEEKLIERFAGKVEGVILISSRMPEERLQGLAEKIPIVLVNRDVSGIPRVLIDAGASLKQAVRLLAHQGHQEIAYLSGPSVTWTNKQRQAAISEVTNELGLRLVIIPTEKPSLESGQAVVDQMINSGVTGAIAFNDLIAHGIMTELNSRSFSVPDSFSIVGCDNSISPFTNPPLTSVSNETTEAGKIACEMIMGVLGEMNSKNDQIKVLETLLIERETIGPPCK